MPLKALAALCLAAASAFAAPAPALLDHERVVALYHCQGRAPMREELLGWHVGRTVDSDPKAPVYSMLLIGLESEGSLRVYPMAQLRGAFEVMGRNQYLLARYYMQEMDKYSHFGSPVFGPRGAEIGIPYDVKPTKSEIRKAGDYLIMRTEEPGRAVFSVFYQDVTPAR